MLLLDGAMGTMIQQYNLTETDYKGDIFRGIDRELKGCHDILSLTRPDVVAEIHEKYLEAGADIITTNSFNANAISLGDYNLSGYAYRIAFEAAKTARTVADVFSARTPSKPRFVAGTVGPTNKTASMSSDIMNPAKRDVTFAELAEAYSDQIEGLIDGGCDIILIETVFDTLNAKAALFAVNKIADKRGERIPLMISATLSDSSGRTLSGQTLEAFYTSVAHADLLSVGLNCAFGPSQLLPYVGRLSEIAECHVSCHPNAGLPNALGEYDETPGKFAEKIRTYLAEGYVNIIGGCCGTTPAHIREISAFIDDFTPRRLPPRTHTLKISNLEPLTVSRETNFVNIGERTNVAGSAKFARLIREGNYEEAVTVALRQIEAGAQVIDICMDDALINGAEAMRTFLCLLASEPEIARVPVMIDSSEWEVIVAGLQACQGKCIVNSISLKEGEDVFIARAKEIRNYGAAVVVMLFDEEGQADTFDKKCKVAQRAYRLLTENGFPPEDIIFDPNILTIATGIAGHDRYALDFIEATRWIKKNLPYSHVSGGVSNLSFAFRGNNAVREAMHSVFLYHAIKAGMDMAIVNSQMLKVYSDIGPELLERIEDLVFLRRSDATERLLEYARGISNDLPVDASSDIAGEKLSVAARVRRQLLKGVSDSIEADLAELQTERPDSLEIIEKVLMPVMDEIGTLFGEGKMFLPQVIKSARVLKQSIAFLAPAIASTDSKKDAGKVIIATVRGDIHDIGKNIVSLVVGCNGYDVVDLGVMVDAKKIADEAEAIQPVAVMLSGLITPSLNEMVEVCREFERRGLTVPVIIGGATTSPLHTALKIAPVYRGLVIHAPDASYNSRILSRLTSADFIALTRKEQENLRNGYNNARNRSTGLLTIEEARRKAVRKTTPARKPVVTEKIVFTDFPIDDVDPYINWGQFFSEWGLKKKWPEILYFPEYKEEALRLHNDALNLLEEIKEKNILRLQAVVNILPARSEDEDIVVGTPAGERKIPMLREQAPDKFGECVADRIAPDGDHICLFALSAGVGLKDFIEDLRAKGNDYAAVMAKLLADRLTEAFAEKIHSLVRRELWAFEQNDPLSVNDILKGEYSGCRIAFGYPAIPDHTLKKDIFDILEVEKSTDMRLTENAMIVPEESLCGIILSDGEYFTIGKIDESQLTDYGRRRNVTVDEIKKILPFYLTQ